MAATGMIHSAFETLNPAAALWGIIFAICKIAPHGSGNAFLWSLSPKKTHFLASLSIKKARKFFSNLVDDLDPDGLCYGRIDVLATEAKIENLLSIHR
jgi:hypothetical protein